MANSNNSNKKLVPEAMDALEKFKYTMVIYLLEMLEESVVTWLRK